MTWATFVTSVIVYQYANPIGSSCDTTYNNTVNTVLATFSNVAPVAGGASESLKKICRALRSLNAPPFKRRSSPPASPPMRSALPPIHCS